ncbi:MAG: guanylate kinase [Lachnospiraceae bacterium]|nr:guanylate kinase [Lachnospiraceae bacterium]
MQGLLIVISGFSGVGKGTLINALLDRYPDAFRLSVSATSRAPREGETEGVEYFFKTEQEFRCMIEDGELLEYAKYNGNYYGTPKAFVYDTLERGRNLILEIEVTGGMNIKRIFPDAFLVYVLPPSAAELKRRLVNRGTETMEEIGRRLARAVEETDCIRNYDYVTVNDDFETCLEELYRMICMYRQSMHNRARFSEELKKELEDITRTEEE